MRHVMLTFALIGLAADFGDLRWAASRALAGDAVIDETLVAHAERLSNAFRQAAALAQPSVVTIVSEKRPAKRQPFRNEGPSIPEELRRFFGDDFERFFRRPQPDFGDAQRGFASGIIISGDGYILTNNHVVVTQVEPGGAAQRAGLQPKDLILSINGVSVSDASEFQNAIGEMELEKGVRLQVRSEDKNRFVFLRRQR